MKAYLQNNLVKSFRTSPFRVPLKAWVLVPVYAAIAVAIGFGTGLIEYEPLNSKLVFVLPLTLFIFPSLLEEVVFRGILIPRNVLSSGVFNAVKMVLLSTVLFVIWHPVNALIFNHSAIPLFLDPWFLVIVGALGLTCGYSYVVSRSIWVPVLIHCATVVIWVFFLGGRNLILEA